MRIAAFAVLLVLVPDASASGASSMVDATPGSLPLLLTVPHDGAESLGTVPPRSKGVRVRDADTRLLAGRIADALHEQTGQRPYVVIARFSRDYLDANRPAAQAMESADALPAYRAYHDRVAAYVAELNAKFPGGALLIDVHGQATDANTTFRGTRSGLTTKRLIGRYGPESIQGANSITGLLAARGHAVEPAPDARSLRESRYTGGHTVAHYGSHRPGGIDAIQLEFGAAQRKSASFARDVADALVAFMKAHGLQ